jgi:hypothetical protein
MRLKLLDDFVEESVVYGPLPNLNDSFESFFIRKAFQSLYESTASETPTAKYIVRFLVVACVFCELDISFKLFFTFLLRRFNFFSQITNSSKLRKTKRSYKKSEKIFCYERFAVFSGKFVTWRKNFL